MKHINYILNILFVYIIFIQYSFSQNQLTTESTQGICVLEFGLGRSSADVEMVVGAAYETEQFIYALRYSSQSEFDLFNSYTPVNENILYDAIIGVHGSVWFLNIYAATGVGYIHQITRGQFIHSGGGLLTEGGPAVYESIIRSNIGIPFHSSIAFSKPLFGIFQGVIACHTSISVLRPIWGISFTMRFYIFKL